MPWLADEPGNFGYVLKLKTSGDMSKIGLYLISCRLAPPKDADGICGTFALNSEPEEPNAG